MLHNLFYNIAFSTTGRPKLILFQLCERDSTLHGSAVSLSHNCYITLKRGSCILIQYPNQTTKIML